MKKKDQKINKINIKKYYQNMKKVKQKLKNKKKELMNQKDLKIIKNQK